ncbi:MAG: TIGR03936 family radical SAM-associated protein [Fusobacteria bacterium]|nr:TIGR03936 family radical SAM-associated protein [Fusobacteriota bacterium]
MRVRLKFNKEGKMRFISHLEFMKFIERYLRRCGIVFETTQGFHKRAKLSLGPAAPFGMNLYNEPIDVDIQECKSQALETMLNSNVVEGFKIVSYEILGTGDKLSSKYTTPIYEMIFINSEIKEQFESRLESGEPLVFEQKEAYKDMRESIVKYEIYPEKIKLLMNLSSPMNYLRQHFPEGVEVKRIGYSEN